jgi:hypothetical protein
MHAARVPRSGTSSLHRRRMYVPVLQKHPSRRQHAHALDLTERNCSRAPNASQGAGERYLLAPYVLHHNRLESRGQHSRPHHHHKGASGTMHVSRTHAPHKNVGDHCRRERVNGRTERLTSRPPAALHGARQPAALRAPTAQHGFAAQRSTARCRTALGVSRGTGAAECQAAGRTHAAGSGGAGPAAAP